MTRRRGRRPLACHHEAGHAVARWTFCPQGVDSMLARTAAARHIAIILSHRACLGGQAAAVKSCGLFTFKVLIRCAE